MRLLGSALIAVGVVASMATDAGAESSIAAQARVVAHDLGPVPPHALVVASPLKSDVAAPRGDELAARLAALVASASGSDTRAEPSSMTLAAAEARARVAKSGALVYLDVRVESGELRLTADLHPVVANGWDRLRAGPPPPGAHAYAHGPVTAEVRAYLAPLHLERAEVRKFGQDVGPLLALACGDLEGQGGNELVLVSEREVAFGFLQGGRFVAKKRVPAAKLGTRTPVPFREPLAAALTVSGEGPGTAYVGWGDRFGAKLGPDLATLGRLAGLPVALGDGVACVVPLAAEAGWQDALVACDDGRAVPGGSAGSAAPMVVDAWTAFDLVGAGGETTRVVASHEPSGALHLRRPGRAGMTDTATMADVGTQLAVLDLDQDGVAEVVTTLPRGRGEEDALLVWSWVAEGLAPRLRWAAPSGVDAVAACPAEANDAPSIVAAVGPEIWLVR